MFHSFKIALTTLSMTGILFVVGMFAFHADAVVPQGDTGSWMVSIDSIVPTDANAVVHGTLYNGINPAGANISITTRHITSASATQVQNGSQTNGVTNSAGKFAITISPLASGTSYSVNATATAPQGTLATSTVETFTTNQANTDNSILVAYNNPQPPKTAHGMVLKFKASAVSSATTATIRLKKDNVVVKTNTVQVTPDATGNALFQTPFTGLSPSTTYDVEVMIGDGPFIGLSPMTTATATGGQPPATPFQISINDVTIASTTATIEGVVIGDGQATVSIRGTASTDGTNYGINSSIGYTGAPNATWGAGFTTIFTGLTPSTHYYYKITDTLSGKDLSSIYYFTTGSSSGGVGSPGTDGPWFTLDADYQSAIKQTNKCTEGEGEYCMLAPIPFPGIVNGKLGLTPDTTGNSGVSNFINGIIQFAIAFAGLLAVIMIIAGGVLYATSEAMGSKAQAKTMITNAIFGLLLALCSYLILKTINPALVDVKLDIARHEVIVSGADGFGIQSSTGDFKDAPNIILTDSTNASNKISVKACDPSQMVTIPFLGKTVTIEKHLVGSLNRINAKWIMQGSLPFSKQYKIVSIDGGYVCKHITGLPNTASFHSYGIAIDINQKGNEVNYNGGKGDMPPEFVKLFTDEGWGWGGNWKTKKDPMHFSKQGNGTGSGEGGNQKF